MIFSLIQDFADALAAMPRKHPRQPILTLLDAALRRDVHLIDQHPTTLFQCLWNTCWWYDCSEAADYYKAIDDDDDDDEVDTATEGMCDFQLAPLLESWRDQKQQQTPDFIWLRALRPPGLALGAQQAAVFPVDAEVRGLCFAEQDRTLVSLDKAGKLLLWSVETGQLMRGVQTPAGSGRLLRWRGGEPALVRELKGGLEIWNLEGSQLLAAFADPWRTAAAGDLDVSIATDRVAAVLGAGYVCIWVLSTAAIQATIQHAECRFVALSPADPDTVATTGPNGVVHVWSLAESPPKLLRRIICESDGGDQPNNNARITGLRFVVGGRQLLCNVLYMLSADQIESAWLRLLDVASGQASDKLRSRSWPVKAFDLAGNGRLLATACFEYAELWELHIRELLRVFKGHDGETNCVAISENGMLVASSAKDKTIRLWRVKAQPDRRKLLESGYPIGFVAFAPRGDLLLSRDEVSIQGWDIESGRRLFEKQNDAQKWIRATVEFHGDRYRTVLTSKGPTFRDGSGQYQAEEIAGPFCIRDRAVEYLPMSAVIGWLAEEMQSVTSYPDCSTIAGATGTHVHLFRVEGNLGGAVVSAPSHVAQAARSREVELVQGGFVSPKAPPFALRRTVAAATASIAAAAEFTNDLGHRDYDWFATSVARAEVNGDFVGVLSLQDGRRLLVVADAGGWGPRAGIIMQQTCHALLGIAQQGIASAPDAMRRLNNEMCRAFADNNHFVTLMLGLLNGADHTIEFSSAGHYAPVVRRNTGILQSALPLDLVGPPLGVMPDIDYGSEFISLAAGETVTFYTDGLFDDGLKSPGHAFSEATLLGLLRGATGAARSVGLYIVEQFMEHQAGTSPKDDWTLVVLGRKLDCAERQQA